MRDLDQENVVSILRDCDANVVILQELATRPGQCNSRGA